MSNPSLELDLGNTAVPPYDQIRGQIIAMISAGTLAPGMRLPTVRDLAGDLRVAPGTVARAYKELEAAGWVVAAGRRGTTVAPDPPVASQPPRPVLEAIRELRDVAIETNYPESDLLSYLGQILK